MTVERPEEAVDHPFTNDFLATLVHVWQFHYWTFLLLNYEDIVIYRTSLLQCKWPGDKNVISQLLAMASYRELPPIFVSLISPLRRGSTHPWLITRLAQEKNTGWEGGTVA